MDSTRKAAWVAAFSLTVLSWADAATSGSARHFQVEAYRSDASARSFVSYRLDCVPLAAAGSWTDQAVVATFVRSALASKSLEEALPGAAPDVQITVSFRVEERNEVASRYSRRYRPVTHRIRTIEVPVTHADGTIRRVTREIVLPVSDGYVASASERRTARMFAKSLEISARARQSCAGARSSRSVARAHRQQG